MSKQTKGLLFLVDVQGIDAKLVAVAVAQSAVTIELADRIGLNLDDIEFTTEHAGQVIRFKLIDMPKKEEPT